MVMHTQKISPVITHHARDFVHHILIYVCTTPLNESSLSESGPCDTQPSDVQNCRRGLIIGGWAVGGEVYTNYQLCIAPQYNCACDDNIIKPVMSAGYYVS